MMRVQRLQKPSSPDADYSQIFFFDKHYALSSLYCQQIRYATTTAIPRLVGAVCPPEEEEDGEPHAAHKLMLFCRARCPGPEHCADPLIFRSLLLPSDSPDDDKAVREKPHFGPCWRACRSEMEGKAAHAAAKEKRAEKIAVLADTTLMKDWKSSGGSHSAARLAFRLRPPLLKILAYHFDTHAERMPHGTIELVDTISCFLCGHSMYHTDEQLHLAEFVALEAQRINRNIDMDIMVRKKPFRESKQGGFVNDIESEVEAMQEANVMRSEFLGGADEDDNVVEDAEGDTSVRRQALFHLSLDECKAMLRRDQELQRASAVGRPREADVQMKRYVEAFGSVLRLGMPEATEQRRLHLAASLPFNMALDFQRAVAKEMRMQQQERQ